jgi:phage shock protein C
MSTRTRQHSHTEEEQPQPSLYRTDYSLEDEVTDADIEDFLSQHEETEERQGFFNLPTIAGLATIGVGAAYLLERYGLLTTEFEIGNLVGPWLFGVLIILMGFVFLSWKPRRARRHAARKEAAERRARQRRERTAEAPPRSAHRASTREESLAGKTKSGRKHFAKSASNRKIAGVCGGIGEYFGIDPTIVRIAFVVALIAGQGMALPLYLVLAFAMPRADAVTARSGGSEPLDDERVIVIRS